MKYQKYFWFVAFLGIYFFDCGPIMVASAPASASVAKTATTMSNETVYDVFCVCRTVYSIYLLYY